MTGTVLILTALRFEGRAIGKGLGLSFSSPAVANGSTPAGEPVALRVVGPRCEGLSRLHAAEGCRGIIMAGLGGGLDPTLEAGEVVVDRESDLAVPAGRWRRGDIHTTAGVVATVAAKRALFAETGALVVDMENEIARRFTRGHGLAFLGIRAVSDRADEPLDPATLGWVDSTGGLRPARLAADLCRSPATIPALWRLGRRSRVAVQNLTDAVRQVVFAPQDATPHDSLQSGSIA